MALTLNKHLGGGLSSRCVMGETGEWLLVAGEHRPLPPALPLRSSCTCSVCRRGSQWQCCILRQISMTHFNGVVRHVSTQPQAHHPMWILNSVAALPGCDDDNVGNDYVQVIGRSTLTRA